MTKEQTADNPRRKQFRFMVVLPPPLAELFLEEMRREDRKKLSLARYIISEYFREKQARLEYERIKQLRSSGEGPHFYSEPPTLPQSAKA